MLLCGGHAQSVDRVIARVRGAPNYPTVSGTVAFEQPSGQPLAPITVRVDVSNLQPNLQYSLRHAFHVHQFGDVRTTYDLSTMAAHFVPYCEPPAPDPVTGAIPPDAPCIKDQVHGLPPAEIRQPGDMGNLETAVPRTSTVRTPRATTPHCCVRVTSHALSLVGAPRIHRR